MQTVPNSKNATYVHNAAGEEFRLAALDPRYRLIPLSRGLVTIVDASDYEWLCLHKWYALWSPTTRGFYAVRNTHPENGRKHQGSILMHRAILDAPKGIRVDHRNRNSLDNRRSTDNLRLATARQNCANSSPRSNKTGFRGVYRGRTKYIAAVAGEHVGCYLTAHEAALARDIRALQVFGEFAVLNFPKVAA